MNETRNEALKAGHDRSLGGIIGTMLAYASIHALGIAPGDIQTAAIYGSAGTLGAMVGALIPDAYRQWIWAVGAFVLALLGVSS